jgi:lipid II:glycine glycyltransferase (peptidoglycan interpeptide bridge formation enzyme)
MAYLCLDTADRNPEWDAFVAAAPGGHHAQTSLWAGVKAVLGWDAQRVLLRDGGAIVGGVQLLTRAVAPGCRVAFAPRGPLVPAGDRDAVHLLLGALDDLGRRERIRYLKLQPPAGRHELVTTLATRGWAPSTMEAAPTATVRVDLTADEDELLRRMRKRTREKIRQAPRRGLVIREAGDEDFPTYCAIVEATSRRQGFGAYPRRYYEAMWREFSASGDAVVLMAELEGRVLSATLLVGYGDRVTYKMGGWSGDKAPVQPNEAIHWAGMQWAKAAGYQYYDFDGIHKSIAAAVLAGGELPESARSGVAHFKLGFGGEVEVFPGAMDRSPTVLLRPVVRLAAPRMDRMKSVAHRALGRAA